VRSPLRHAVLILAAVCFLAMASGLALCLHLAHREDPLHHDWDHCSLCQAIAINGTKFHIESPTTVIGGGDLVTTFSRTRQVSPRQSIPSVPAPRAPPSIAI
jgi:hypothetical protein